MYKTSKAYPFTLTSLHFTLITIYCSTILVRPFSYTYSQTKLKCHCDLDNDVQINEYPSSICGYWSIMCHGKSYAYWSVTSLRVTITFKNTSKHSYVKHVLNVTLILYYSGLGDPEERQNSKIYSSTRKEWSKRYMLVVITWYAQWERVANVPGAETRPVTYFPAGSRTAIRRRPCGEAAGA